MGIVQQLAREVAKDNVRVNAIAQALLTPESSTLPSRRYRCPGVIKLCLDRTPMPRLGKPSEVSSLVEYLLGDEAGYINGQIIALTAVTALKTTLFIESRNNFQSIIN